MGTKQPEALPEPPGPPEHLSESSKELWRSVVPRRLQHPESVALLLAALEARDRAEAARLAIAEHGMIEKGGDMKHVSPLVKIEKDSLALFGRLWAALNLNWGGGTKAQWRGGARNNEDEWRL